MKKILAFALLLFVHAAYAQQKPKSPAPAGVKTIAGIRTESLRDVVGVYAGRNLAVLRDFSNFFIVDITKGTIREAPRQYEGLSPDFRYNYYTEGFYDVRYLPDGSWEKKSRIYIVSLDGGERDTIISEYFPFGIDSQGRIIATKAVVAENKKQLGCLLGLYALDRKTGQPVATFRTDTIYHPGRLRGWALGGDWADNGTPRRYSLQPSAVIIKAGRQQLQIIPLNGSPIVMLHHREVGDRGFDLELIDEENVYLHPDDVKRGRELTAYSRRTGNLAAQHKFANATDYQMLYATGTNCLYRYDRAQAMVYKEVTRDGAFVATDSFRITGLNLSQAQRWAMQVCMGPSLLFTPYNLDQAEAGGTEANTASLVQLPSGKLSLRITPFYNRSTMVVAQQAAAQQEFNERSARNSAESERRKKLQDAERCKAAWNNEEYHKGVTRLYRNTYVILESYDCTKDEYRFFKPRQPDDYNERSNNMGWQTANSQDMRLFGTSSSKQYHTCSDCDGLGSVLETTTTTRTKDLPWGYFSGIETQSTRTTTKKEVKLCSKCGGRGIVLE